MSTSDRTHDPSREVIASYRHDGATYEIDHLGIAVDSQYGEFAVYRNGVQVAEFATEAAFFLPAHRPELPSADALVALAKHAVNATAAGGSR